MKVIVAYDVSNDDARARLSAALATYGVRIQRSVYECFLDEQQLAEVLDRARRLIDVRHDVVHAFPVCVTCAEHRQSLGQDIGSADEAYWIAF